MRRPPLFYRRSKGARPRPGVRSFGIGRAPGGASEPQQPRELRSIEADHDLLPVPYDGHGRGHRPQALELRHRLLVFGYVPDGGLDALLAEELLRPVAEQSARLLHVQNHVFLGHPVLLSDPRSGDCP